ncbi:hypothetical protein G9A89_009007 [Geosiphon pyriformis]|nr:hypothetical protein G9A89_009007 [Geosiphon pyriformis]
MQTLFKASLVEKYERALSTGELLFTESTVTKVPDEGVEFEVRFAPSLLKKPSGAPLLGEVLNSIESKVDPFAPYNPSLFLEEYGPYVVLLNKYCVIPYHILVVTKEFEKQTDPLFPRDLGAVWHYMMQIQNKKSIAFYNCGEASGASQFHKHLQLIPLADNLPIETYLNRAQYKRPGEIFQFPHWSFIHHVLLLDPQRMAGTDDQVIGEYLGESFHSLLDAMIESLRTQMNANALNLTYPPSYNFLVTPTWMLIVPRNKEKFEQISVNSLGFAGMLLVKSQEDLEFVKKIGVTKILNEVAVPNPAENPSLL